MDRGLPVTADPGKGPGADPGGDTEPSRNTIRVRAPGRVNLIGDHTDYHDGLVLPLAIDRECRVTLAPVSGERVTAESSELPGRVELPADGSADPAGVEPAWGRFLAGVLQVARADPQPQAPDSDRTTRASGVGAHLRIASTVPPGAGLSSSSALTVALTLAWDRYGDRADDARSTARRALEAEIAATGVPGGLMDQLCSLLGRAGHALLIDCRDLTVEPVPLPEDYAVVVVHSGTPRTLAGSEYAQRRHAADAAAAALGLPTLRDAAPGDVAADPIARHVVTENARVIAAAGALRAGDVHAFGRLMLASHASLRDDFRVSTPELDLLVDLLMDHGALGARLTGAGFGGCVVALVGRPRAASTVETIVERYDAATGRTAHGFTVRAVDGASFLDGSA